MTLDADRVRVGGNTAPTAEVTVNGEPLRVYPSGAFAGTVALTPGRNEIVFRAIRDGRVREVRRTVNRPRPLVSLPATPIRFDANYGGAPSAERVVRVGDVVDIRVKGSPGGRATFRVGADETQYPLRERTDGEVRGIYEGAYQVRPADHFEDARITCYLWDRKARRSTEPAARLTLPARITVDTRPFPDVARVREDYTRLRANETGGAPIAVASSQTLLNITGRIGDRVRVMLSPTLPAWLDREKIEMMPNATPLRRGVVRNLSVASSDQGTVVRIPLGLRVPFSVTGESEGATLDLMLFGVDNRLNWIVDRSTTGASEAIAPMPSDSQTARLQFTLRRGGLLGYRTWYEGATFCLAVRPMPKAAGGSQPLAGRTILLDPGHGGSSPGCMGCTGVEEKGVNLQLCRKLQAHLEKRGAQVRLTRPDDSVVSLADRARMTERDCDLFVSIHNNSIDLSGDPIAARGAGVFYYHPHSRDLARSAYDRILALDPAPEPYGLITTDLFVVREVTAAPSILVECLFMSNPEDEMLLLDGAYSDRYMEAVAQGIEDWFAAAARKVEIQKAR
jgi:N-acetylmuramoyl-L-alanine amidase